jgi:hypothetical protein
MNTIVKIMPQNELKKAQVEQYGKQLLMNIKKQN